ncbi:mannosyl-oligosaccharide alpha-1,2-mannosidase isoform B-like protein [Fimicolochytrium jonesii]|uniref:mannosyl-oligosaccharide alpha-1,2-mannosidase isoform B-like protein n=1 Tax=Fimicolochytrium jonesii TaxID=1396493 RepID=UPI0022FF22B4|nr:mannosyl-oligosaccharide alpha-1,2-mannosidase isoform B-like protein [Fimicolochytrium jonesii]KAI8820443.1 mannosyl-oligosaccharide alpha-1,2-mannosidase isoform B-like protein [Fimicolochytrium jonesii]
MMIHAWDSYVQYASPDDELRPVSARGFNWSTTSLLATPVDSLDTLRLMGLESRYQSAKILVLKELKIDADIGVSVFETNIRILGGLLSAWEFDDDPRLLDLAERLAVRLIRALDTPSGMPDRTINLNSGGAEGPPATLAEYGSLQLELQYLADVTGKPHYAKKVRMVIYEIIQANTTVKGLYPKGRHCSHTHLSLIERGKETFGIGPNADSFYEYLLKIWMATGDAKFRTMYDESAEAINKYLVHHRNGRTYVPDADLRHDTNTVAKHTTSHHLACFAGGMFATGALTRREDNWEQFFQLGKQITQTCWEGYEKTATGLGPEQVGTAFNTDSDGRYMLRPETIESVFYMWRLTREPIYRSMGRVFLTSLNKHCRTDTGFSGLRSVSTLPASLDDVQPSFFLAETLKYLYLLFADDDTIPLEAYVFNTEAHPLSVRGWGRRRGIPRGDVDLGVGRSAGEEL